MVNIPTTAALTATFVANFESKINQSSPLNDKAFIRTLSAGEAMAHTGLHKYGVDAIKQNLALSASGVDLERLGSEHGVVKKAAKATALVIEYGATSGGGATITTSHKMVGIPNGVRYTVDANATEVSGVITVSVTSEVAGIVGNLNPGDQVQLETNIAGAARSGAVASVTTTGAEEEDEEVYRQRVLFEIRTVGGGGNAADNKRWAEEVPSVLRAYPYSGNPVSPATSLPGDRTVYIEVPTSIEADGIPTTAILLEARTSITTDPDTGLARQPLGLVDSTLFVEAITRTVFDTQITGLVIDPGKTVAAKAEVDTALDTYYRQVLMFVDAIDVEDERNDTITQGTVWTTVQGVLTKFGATAQSIVVSSPGGPITEYQVDQGEMTKGNPATYV